MFKQLIYIALFSIIGFTACQSQTTKKENTKTENTTINISKTYTLKGFNKSCCVGIVNYALKEVDGFAKAETNVAKQQITVWFNSEKTNEANIKKVINKTAYKIIE